MFKKRLILLSWLLGAVCVIHCDSTTKTEAPTTPSSSVDNQPSKTSTASTFKPTPSGDHAMLNSATNATSNTHKVHEKHDKKASGPKPCAFSKERCSAPWSIQNAVRNKVCFKPQLTVANACIPFSVTCPPILPIPQSTYKKCGSDVLMSSKPDLKMLPLSDKIVEKVRAISFKVDHGSNDVKDVHCCQQTPLPPSYLRPTHRTMQTPKSESSKPCKCLIKSINECFRPDERPAITFEQAEEMHCKIRESEDMLERSIEKLKNRLCSAVKVQSQVLPILNELKTKRYVLDKTTRNNLALIRYYHRGTINTLEKYIRQIEENCRRREDLLEEQEHLCKCEKSEMKSHEREHESTAQLDKCIENIKREFNLTRQCKEMPTSVPVCKRKTISRPVKKCCTTAPEVIVRPTFVVISTNSTNSTDPCDVSSCCKETKTPKCNCRRPCDIGSDIMYPKRCSKSALDAYIDSSIGSSN